MNTTAEFIAGLILAGCVGAVLFYLVAHSLNVVAG